MIEITLNELNASQDNIISQTKNFLPACKLTPVETFIMQLFRRSAFVDAACHFGGSGMLMELTYNNIPGGRDFIGRMIDKMILSNRECSASRNRLKMVISELRNVVPQIIKRNGHCKILSCPCGTARDIFEFLGSSPVTRDKLTVTCIDLDPGAVQYARERFARNGFVAEVGIGDIFQIQNYNVDLFICVGLAEYIPPGDTSRLLKLLKHGLYPNIKPGSGRLIFSFETGKTAKQWVSRRYLGWATYQRSIKEIECALLQAGFSRVSTRIEPLGIEAMATAYA